MIRIPRCLLIYPEQTSQRKEQEALVSLPNTTSTTGKNVQEGDPGYMAFSSLFAVNKDEKALS